MQFPTRDLTRPEHDLLRALQEAAFQKWSPILQAAESAADQAEKDAKQIDAEVKASTEYVEIHRLLKLPSPQLGDHFKTLADGDIQVGCVKFQAAWRACEAPIHEANAASRKVYDRLDDLKNEAEEDEARLIALAFLRLGYQAGVQDALTTATGPANPAYMLKFMHDVMDNGPATDALVAATVDKLLATPAMAAVLGGDR